MYPHSYVSKMLFGTTSQAHRGLEALLMAGLLLQGAAAVPTLNVNTTVGIVNGAVNASTPNVAHFLGIPFAEAPVGNLRWAPPVAKAVVPGGNINATAFGPACVQLGAGAGGGQSVFSVDAPQFGVQGPTSEDCLSLGIWAPFNNATANSARLPVLVWIYGGAFLGGGGNTPYQIPASWVQRTQGHIVVQINYRLNIFGFPNAAGTPQNLNLGLLDQRLGLEWVRANIANFGGDPTKITLWGQSAGAASVDFYNFAYPQDPIVSGLIMDSGTAGLGGFGQGSVPVGSQFTQVATGLGCGNMAPAQELACMRNVSTQNIANFISTQPIMGGGAVGGMALPFGPILDNVTVFANNTARAMAGQFTKVPAIVGTNNNEGAALSGWFMNGTTVNVTAANIATAGMFCNALSTMMTRFTAGAKSFQYYYTGNFSNIAPRIWEGAYHSAELPLLFGTSAIVRGADTAFETSVSQTMQDLWLAFIKDPVNGLPAAGWPAFSPTGSAMEFAANNMVVQNTSVSRFASQCQGTVGIPNVQIPDLDLVDPAAYSAAQAAVNGGQGTFSGQPATAGVSTVAVEAGMAVLAGAFAVMIL